MEIWKLLIALFYVPNTGALTVQYALIFHRWICLASAIPGGGGGHLV